MAATVEYTLHRRPHAIGYMWVAVNDLDGFEHAPCACPRQAHAGPSRGGSRPAHRTGSVDHRGAPVIPDDDACAITDPLHVWTHRLNPV